MESPIKHVVVLVQENRSFDHILGWMKEINPEIDGVTGKESNSNSSDHLLYFQKDAVYVDPDPDHSFEAIYEQVFGQKWTAETEHNNKKKKAAATMDGFVRNAEARAAGLGEVVMNGFKPESVPVFKQLVSEFAVCDRWFASLPDATQPNRLYVHAATSHGATGNDTKQLIKGFPQKTIFDSIHEAGLTFGIYYAYPPSTLFYRNLRKAKYLKHFHQFDLSFKRDCREGKLPNYVVIEQRYFELGNLAGNDDHPSHDISEGQRFVKQVYEELRASPLWNQILFVVVYDEHGGFYDHVPTPVEGVPNPDGLIGPEPYNFNFDRLGVRVPAILISPWIQPGTVLHEPSGPYPSSQYEHSSIPATVKKIFNLNSFLTKRDEWAGTFDCVLTRTTPRDDCPVTLEEPIRLRETGTKEGDKLNDFQQQIVQMAAVLNGDHKKKVVEEGGSEGDMLYPHKLVENMKVVDAVNYVSSSLDTFFDKLKSKAAILQNGTITNLLDDSDSDSDSDSDQPAPATTRSNNKSFAQKLFSCLICDH